MAATSGPWPCGAADLFSELIARLPDLPVGRAWGREDVEQGVAREVPEEPMDQADLLSYLLFDGAFAGKLIELGRADARARHEELCAFFAAAPP